VKAPKGKHSAKPDIFYEIIEKMYPALTKVEMFARKTRSGWAWWGNEVSREYNPKVLKRHFVPFRVAV
jgi:N6-adenosine-specific RNA methylase IME4